MPPGLAFATSLGLTAGIFASSAAPSPFYELQHRVWMTAPFFVTIAVAVYAVTFLLALLTVGSLADVIGYRPVIFIALISQAGAALLFMLAPSIEWVIAARAIQGFGMGAVVGALAVCVTTFAPGRFASATGPTLAVASPQIGSALGSFTAGWSIQYLAHPELAVYGFYAVLFGIGAIAVLFLPGERPERAWTWRTLLPSVTVPASARTAFWRAVPVIFAGWMLSALYLGLVPILVRDLLGADSPLTGGATVAAYSAIAGVAGLAATHVPARLAVLVLSGVMVAGSLLAAAATVAVSFPLFAAATVLCALGFGGANAAAIRTIIPLVDPGNRTAVFSATYVVGYVAFGTPLIIAGLIADTVGVITVAVWYMVVAAALALAGMTLMARSRPIIG